MAFTLDAQNVCISAMKNAFISFAKYSSQQIPLYKAASANIIDSPKGSIQKKNDKQPTPAKNACVAKRQKFF